MSKYLRVSDVPFLMKQWSSANEADPSAVYVSSCNKYKWDCKECGYSWEAVVNSRYKAGGKCPCHESNKVIMPGVNDILTQLPGLKDYYDTEKNAAEGIDISHEGFDSKVIVNWKCPDCGREWKSGISSRSKKENGIRVVVHCPHYNTVKRKKEDVPTIDQVPELYRFWNKDKNPDACTVKSNSMEYADWKCSNCGYEWRTTVVSQVAGTGKCACCELLRVSRAGYSDLFTLIPKAKAFYDFEKNTGIDIYNMGIRNKEPVWWKCPDCNHSWQASIASRIEGKQGNYRFRGCQQCYRNDTGRIVPASSSKKITKYWDYERNKGIDINLTSLHSNNIVHWRCKDCGYTWNSTVKGMHYSSPGCPRCRNSDHFITSYPELMFALNKIFDLTENPGVDISTLRVNTAKKGHFHCKNCGHQWNGKIGSRIRKNDNGTYRVLGCPICDNNARRAISYSEQYPELAATYNASLSGRPMDSLTAVESNTIKLFWNCPTCHRSFPSTLRAMISSMKHSTKGCPYCSRSTLIKGESFGDIHPELLSEYAEENEIDPFKIFPNSKKEVLWRCVNNPEHTWTARFFQRHKGEAPCPVCNRTRQIKGVNTFADVYPEYIDMYSKNNERKPDEIFYNSTLWFKWNCRTCHGEYGAYIEDILSDKESCPFCDNRRILPGYNDFATKHPDLMKEYNYLINYVITDPDNISEKSKEPLWWICSKNPDHNYPMPPARKLWYQKRHRESCPFCKGLRRKKRHFI